MENNITELIFIIDKSGSMSGLENDTIGGFNSMLEKQRGEKAICHISTVFFSEKSQVIHNRVNIEKVEPLTRQNYIPCGCTALLDALGDAINHTAEVQKVLSDDEKAGNIVFVIITDGEENASQRFSSEKIKKMISYEKEKYGWEFIFLGANIDAVKTAETYGISEERTSNFVCDSAGVQLNFSCVAEAILGFRKKGSISKSWNRKIRQDFEERSVR